jgi:hypothetical protein
MGRACSTYEVKACLWDFRGKARRKETTRWEDNIKVHLRETIWVGMNWVDPAQDGDQWRALVNMVMNL